MSHANTGANGLRIERVEGLFIVRARAAHLRVWSPGDTTPNYHGAPLGAIRDRLRTACMPQALCVGAPHGLLVLDRAHRLRSDAAERLVDAGGTLSVRGDRVAVGRGDAFAEDADLAIQGAPLLVEDGQGIPQARAFNLGWRAAIVVFDCNTAGFAVGHETLSGFAARLVNAGVVWAAHGAGGDGVRVMDGRGDWRGSPINKPCLRAWYVAPPRWESVIGVRDDRGSRIN